MAGTEKGASPITHYKQVVSHTPSPRLSGSISIISSPNIFERLPRLISSMIKTYRTIQNRFGQAWRTRKKRHRCEPTHHSRSDDSPVSSPRTHMIGGTGPFGPEPRSFYSARGRLVGGQRKSCPHRADPAAEGSFLVSRQRAARLTLVRSKSRSCSASVTLLRWRDCSNAIADANGCCRLNVKVPHTRLRALRCLERSGHRSATRRADRACMQ